MCQTRVSSTAMSSTAPSVGASTWERTSALTSFGSNSHSHFSQAYIGGKFTVLSGAVNDSVNGIAAISEMAGELDRIKNELTNATTDLGAISEELGASAQEVSASCATVTGACTDTQAQTEEMRAINEHLADAVSFFNL